MILHLNQNKLNQVNINIKKNLDEHVDKVLKRSIQSETESEYLEGQ